MENIMELLQAPFTVEQIEWRVGSTNKDKTKGLALAYVTNRAIQNRLDDTFGCFGWKNEFKEWKATSQICGISVWDETKSEWVTKWDGSDDSATEAVKGGLSDSMKRCAYQWGIGRYLYNLPQSWVPLKDGRYLAETPKLPMWALPKTSQKPPQDKKPTTNTNTLLATKEQINECLALAKTNSIGDINLKILMSEKLNLETFKNISLANIRKLEIAIKEVEVK